MCHVLTPLRKLAVIVRLLDDPETARYHLRGNLDDVRDSAMDCKKEAEKIKGKFEYLVDYIAALQEATIETKSEWLISTFREHFMIL